MDPAVSVVLVETVAPVAIPAGLVAMAVLAAPAVQVAQRVLVVPVEQAQRPAAPARAVRPELVATQVPRAPNNAGQREHFSLPRMCRVIFP